MSDRRLCNSIEAESCARLLLSSIHKSLLENLGNWQSVQTAHTTLWIFHCFENLSEDDFRYRRFQQSLRCTGLQRNLDPRQQLPSRSILEHRCHHGLPSENTLLWIIGRSCSHCLPRQYWLHCGNSGCEDLIGCIFRIFLQSDRSKHYPK